MKISLLSALPHSIGDIEKARGNPKKDYVRNNLRGFFEPSKVIWSSMENALGAEADLLFELCLERNVSVYRNAGIQQLIAAANTSDIVIILAHWKGPYITIYPPDILATMAGLDMCIDACIDESILPKSTKTHISQAVSCPCQTLS